MWRGIQLVCVLTIIISMGLLLARAQATYLGGATTFFYQATNNVSIPPNGLPQAKDADIRKVAFNMCGDACVNVFYCESKFDNSAIGGAGEIGIAQFLPTTWEWMSKKYKFTDNIHNPIAQIKLASLAFNDGLAYHWTCYNKLYGNR